MTYFMGIDGGGSNLRVVITTHDLAICAQTFFGETVNPGTVGRDKSAQTIQSAIQQTLAQANILPDQIAGVGVGIAGASAAHSANWLQEVIAEVTPQATASLSSDTEIALVGAHGERCGVLILAGTGSVAYGVNAGGESLQVGGWGYLMDDEGSGYRIGMDALRGITRAGDGRGEETTLTHKILNHLNLQTPLQLIKWLYRSETPRTRDVAKLAPLVIECASNGDTVAYQIIQTASQELALLCSTVIRRLGMQSPQIAFAGGLLQTPNLLNEQLCTLLNLPQIPEPQYPPVIGAALLAKIRHGE